ncbi:hypothetical protein ACQ4PT_033521 [Festuca glaucescens]
MAPLLQLSKSKRPRRAYGRTRRHGAVVRHGASEELRPGGLRTSEVAGLRSAACAHASVLLVRRHGRSPHIDSSVRLHLDASAPPRPVRLHLDASAPPPSSARLHHRAWRLLRPHSNGGSCTPRGKTVPCASSTARSRWPEARRSAPREGVACGARGEGVDAGLAMDAEDTWCSRQEEHTARVSDLVALPQALHAAVLRRFRWSATAVEDCCAGRLAELKEPLARLQHLASGDRAVRELLLHESHCSCCSANVHTGATSSTLTAASRSKQRSHRCRNGGDTIQRRGESGANGESASSLIFACLPTIGCYRSNSAHSVTW